ncbi:unnamed protein product [Closterium sp. NIES-54]
MWIFRLKRPLGSLPSFKAHYVARGFCQRQWFDYLQTFYPTLKMTTLWVLLHVAAQRDYELHSLEFITAFLQGSLHEEIWLRRPPGFTGSFPADASWVDDLAMQRSSHSYTFSLASGSVSWRSARSSSVLSSSCEAEIYAGSATTLAALGFAPSTTDPCLFLRPDTSLRPFYVHVYVDDLVFATADTEALAIVKSELQKRHTCIDLGESTPLPTDHLLSAPPSDKFVEPSGPYPELVGCLMYVMTCTRPDLAYPCSILARYVAPGRHRPEHWEAANRVLRHLCSTSGMGLVLGGRGPVVLTGHADASWVDNLAAQRSSHGFTFSLGSGSVSWRSTRSSLVLSSSCVAEIYAGAMAA